MWIWFLSLRLSAVYASLFSSSPVWTKEGYGRRGGERKGARETRKMEETAIKLIDNEFKWFSFHFLPHFHPFPHLLRIDASRESSRVRRVHYCGKQSFSILHSNPRWQLHEWGGYTELNTTEGKKAFFISTVYVQPPFEKVKGSRIWIIHTYSSLPHYYLSVICIEIIIIVSKVTIVMAIL